MYLEVYPDIVFILNFGFDFILLFLLKKVNKKQGGIIRMSLAAAAGAACAAIVSIFPRMNLLLKILIMYLAVSILMIAIAFGRMKITDYIKQWIALNLIAYFTGGLMNSIYYHTDFRLYLVNLGKGVIFSNIPAVTAAVLSLLIAAVILLLLKLLNWYKNHSPDYYDVELIYGDRNVSTRGLIDTGNCLYDPIYKRPVMVIENSLMEELLSPEDLGALEKAKRYINGSDYDIGSWDINTGSLVSLRFIPYHSIGKSGMLLGISLDKVLIHTGKETICNEKVTAAVCDNKLSAKENYHVILHKELL